jgi:capping protein alpha
MGDEGESTEGATVEQKINIAQYFIASSPTGEVDDVVKDVKKLVNDDVTLSSAALSKILKDYNIDQMVAAKDPDGNSILVTAHGQIAEDLFLDPATGRVLRFDHLKRKFTEVTDKKQVLDESVNKYRTAIAKEISTYLDEQYKSGKAASAVYGADSGAITICISAANVHLGNYWTGGWRSVYQLNVSSTGSVELNGDIKVNVHYFEDGNVQLHAKLPTKVSITIADEKKTAPEVAKAIRKIETDFQANLEEMYVQMHKSTFKAMRRFWPVTKKPMDWDLRKHNLTAELGQS